MPNTGSARGVRSTNSPRGVRSPKHTAATGTTGRRISNARTLPGIAAFAEEQANEIELHRWLQWQLDDQLIVAQAKALATGMALGILHDLAVGVHPNGSDAWALQDVLALGVAPAGAPPDAFNQQGQDWSQPPWRPDALAEQEYRPFRLMVNAVLGQSGGVRIDHVMGLFRLWWIPKGARAN